MRWAALGVALACVGCGATSTRSDTSAAHTTNDNLPASAIATTSVLDRDASFFLRLDVASLRASPIAAVLSDGQRRGGLFRSTSASRFDPVEGLDAVASMARVAHLSSGGVTSRDWTVVALVRRSHAPRDVVAFAVLDDGRGWHERGPYSAAEFAPPWEGHTAFVGASREIVILPDRDEAPAQSRLIEQLAGPASPIDPMLVFEPGKLGEVRLAMPGLPLGIATIHLTGARLEASDTMAAGVLVEGELTPGPGRDPSTLHASLAQLVAAPGTRALLAPMGLAGALDRLSFAHTSSTVRVSAPMVWDEVGRVVSLLTETTTGGHDGPSAAEPSIVRPVPPPPQ